MEPALDFLVSIIFFFFFLTRQSNLDVSSISNRRQVNAIRFHIQAVKMNTRVVVNFSVTFTKLKF